MKIYFAGTGPLDKKGIKQLHKIIKRRLLSFYYLEYEKIQFKIFKHIIK